MNTIKKPIKATYQKPFSLDNNLVAFNSKQYAKDAEEYINHLEHVMRLTAGNLRDLAVSMGRDKAASACHDLADRLYNATI